MAPVRTEFRRKANPFWQRFIDIRGRERQAFDPLSNSVHHRIGENKATPHDVDINFPPGNADPQLYHIGRELFCTAWQPLYVVDLELAHGCIRKRDGEGPLKERGCPCPSLFDETVFAEFLVLVGRVRVWRSR